MKNLLTINPKLEKEKIVKFLKKTFSEQKIDKVVLGLSGGIDSATVLYLLKEVLPRKNIFAVQMDYKPRKKVDIDLKGINVIDFSIKEIVENFENIIEARHRDFSSTSPQRGPKSLTQNQMSLLLKKDEVKSNFSLSRGPRSGETLAAIKFEEPSLLKNRLGNIMARVRMIFLFDLAKQLGALVCGTENKSENLLGYFTRFGDAASDLEPISHLYKTQVRQIATYLKVPKEIISQSPTAGLWDGQTDEKEFGFTYEEADQILHQFMDPLFQGDDTKNAKILIKKLKKNFPNAEKIIERMKNNQFKSKTPYSLK